MIKSKMKNYNMILREKLQKYWPYHSAKIDKYEYIANKEMLPFNQKQIIEPAKLTYFPFE